ncbi:MAG TPA: protein kinase [Bryobacteraceae bacterium]|nr:protein kinase [Bryobacteraceae bacterium]
MSLASGDCLGPYEILAPIGAGGMGEVYRARDTRLGRDVAIKVSGEQFSERFEREARSIAALNHPNICHLYDVGPNYLVMELIDGEPLKGPLPLDTALEYARQIADALEAAHERGIIHRDLKPANIMLTAGGVVKVLDFGLAKNAEAPPSGDPTHSPTMTISTTRAGMILGTAAYMAPEQARGKNVDKRADIWAFGVVLYEMLTGKQLFHGETVSDILAAVLKTEPDFSGVPVTVRRLLRSCLQKNPRQRLHDIADAKLLLEDTPVEASIKRRWLWPAVAVALAVGLAATAFVHLRETPPAEPVSMRFQIPPPENTQFEPQMALSPDGRLLAFTTLSASDPVGSIWVRPLDALQARPLRLARTGMPFFWSPDSRFIAYSGDSKLTKIDISGGPPQVLCDAPLGVIGGFWTKEGTIVFGQTPGGLMKVPASGGVPSPLGNFDPASARGQVLPALLPDARHFLYYTNVERNTGIVLTSFGAKPGSEKLMVATPVGAAFAPSPDSRSGHLLFLRDGTLMAQPLDLDKLAMDGTPVPIAEGVGTSLAHGFFSASNTGVLAYRTGSSGGVRLAWVDRNGKEIGSVGPTGDYRSLALSPDGTRVATTRVEAGNEDIWVFDIARNTNTRLTSDPASDNTPVWSRDGSRIAWASGKTLAGNQREILMTLAAGDAKPEMLVRSGAALRPWDWSGDGRLVLYSAAAETGKTHLWTVTVDGERKREPLTQTEFNELMPQVSPDGRWISYMSDESGRFEIYVRSFPPSAEHAGKIKVSEGGGTQARWSRDGKELFYISGETKMMAVDVSTAPSFKAGVPQPLFQTSVRRGQGYQWDVSADGKRFLIDTVGAEKSDAITIVTNWQSMLKR